MKDETGNKYGLLTVLYRTPNTGDAGNKIKWHCRCECGNEKDIDGGSLRSGTTKSCGCLQKEIVSKINLKNLIGQRYGKLLVIKPTSERKNGYLVWACQCDCGRIHFVDTNALTQGRIQSCGHCNHKSLGEEKIEKLLKENNLSFTQEKTFSNCYLTDKRGKMRFDFYVNDAYLIEYDGKQHFIQDSGYGKDLKNIQQRDAYKNQWCKENNIPLIRIPYTHFNELCIEDLLLETSKFRIV